MKHIEVGRYKTVYKGSIHEIQHATAVLPSGKRVTFEQSLRRPIVMVLAVDDKGRVLLTREFRFQHGKYLWWLPAGLVDAGEKPAHAAQRELREEAGMRAKRVRLFLTMQERTFMHLDKFVFIATGITKDPLPHDDGEDITVVPTPIAKAFRMVLDGKIQDPSIAYALVRLYQENKGRKVR